MLLYGQAVLFGACSFIRSSPRCPYILHGAYYLKDRGTRPKGMVTCSCMARPFFLTAGIQSEICSSSKSICCALLKSLYLNIQREPTLDLERLLCFLWQETLLNHEGLLPMFCMARNPIRSRSFNPYVCMARNYFEVR